MAESILLTPGATREQTYQELFPQIESVVMGETHLVANLANIAAMLREAFGFFWVGFYTKVEGKDELVLGPFQGPLACTRIPFSKGVCGAAALTQEAQLVPNVNEFPGHIACSSASQSEVVIPVVAEGTTQLVLDVDSDQLDDFTQLDVEELTKIMELVRKQHFVE
ncbi:GAF domain-containing protein [Pontibacter sp. G13]|uniref:GAF domain-containing protein n=1 Tax=Pontibacter sp. G13 TaxID=3074898 RepID=UPI002889843B|nr:GAF domain-containing protein [Pontibacter sp. G13]WNJ19262.1 GAF domain-containing protein [Pontibacter sp. G13]